MTRPQLEHILRAAGAITDEAETPQRTRDPWYDRAEAVVKAVRAALPAALRTAAQDLPVILEDRPGRTLLDEGFTDDLLGIFDAPEYADTTAADPRPPCIRLFIQNLRDEAEDDPDTFREEVRITFLHELGHFLGLDEMGLAERGLE